ncbi:32627_t:CDS:2, partial [Racocetra persica]
HNRVGIIDLSGLPNLENLYCSGNELEELDLSENTKLKNLVCDNNFFEKLDVKHLSKLESLYCFRCGLEDLDCSGLNELKELYCANNVHEGEEINYRLSKISIEGCDKLEILDCAENNIEELNISNLSKLKQVSCRESKLISINASNCVSLEYLDFSSNFCLHTYNYDGELKDEENCSLAVEEVILDNCPKLSKVFASESFDYDLTKLPNLKILRIDDKETDFVALRNTEKVEQILTNPQDYSIDQIIKLELYGVSSELREKLIALVKQKYEDEIRRKFETLPPLEKDDSLNEDKDQIILALQQKNAELETKIKALETDKNNPQKIEEIRNEILNSELSEEQKQELLKLLEDKKKVSEIQPKPTNY